jgi:hypothetical protein
MARKVSIAVAVVIASLLVATVASARPRSAEIGIVVMPSAPTIATGVRFSVPVPSWTTYDSMQVEMLQPGCPDSPATCWKTDGQRSKMLFDWSTSSWVSGLYGLGRTGTYYVRVYPNGRGGPVGEMSFDVLS